MRFFENKTFPLLSSDFFEFFYWDSDRDLLRLPDLGLGDLVAGPTPAVDHVGPVLLRVLREVPPPLDNQDTGVTDLS